MMRIAFLVLGLFFLTTIDAQFYGSPLSLSSHYVVRNNETRYTIRLTNVSDRPIDRISICRAGMHIHSTNLNPIRRVRVLKPGHSITIVVPVRGQLIGFVESSQIGIEGQYYQGRTRYDVAMPVYL